MTILVETSSGDGFALVTISAINKLTFDGAVKLGAAVTKYGTPYKSLVADSNAPALNPHPRAWLMLERMLASKHECKIKAAPGTDYGATYDIEGTDVDIPTTLVVNPITAPKALKSSGARAKITWPPVPIPTFNYDAAAGGRPQSMAPVPAFIILAHELSHADRIMRGTSLMLKVGSKSGMPASAKLDGIEGLPSFSVDFEHVEMVGWTADAYTCQDPDVVTENEMRAEHGVALRTRY
jgi:hypothetical protein